jgi:hypothetical protein
MFSVFYQVKRQKKLEPPKINQKIHIHYILRFLPIEFPKISGNEPIFM